jgi:hypothetical protein
MIDISTRRAVEFDIYPFTLDKINRCVAAFAKDTPTFGAMVYITPVIGKPGMLSFTATDSYSAAWANVKVRHLESGEAEHTPEKQRSFDWWYEQWHTYDDESHLSPIEVGIKLDNWKRVTKYVAGSALHLARISLTVPAVPSTSHDWTLDVTRPEYDLPGDMTIEFGEDTLVSTHGINTAAIQRYGQGPETDPLGDGPLIGTRRLKNVLTAIEKWTGQHNPVQMSQPSPLKPVRFHAVNDGNELTIVVMPMRAMWATQ